jgi:hypothetical protein
LLILQLLSFERYVILLLLSLFHMGFLVSSYWARKFSLHHRAQTGSGAHPASYPVGTKESFPGHKAGGARS